MARKARHLDAIMDDKERDEKEEERKARIAQEDKGRPSKRQTYKLHIGWLHHDPKGGRCRQVLGKHGGGNRVIEFMKDEPESVNSLIDRGQRLFFPEGQSAHGSYTSMKACLSNYNGEEITEFKDNSGKSCSLQEYLKAQGIYSSQFYVYLLTNSVEKKTADDELENVYEEQDKHIVPQTSTKERFKVNGIIPPHIEMRFTKESQSMYSDSSSYINCYSMMTCFQLSARKSLDFQEYNPFNDGFSLTSLKVGGKQILERNISGEATFCKVENMSPVVLGETDTLLYSPHNLNGIEVNFTEDVKFTTLRHKYILRVAFVVDKC